MLSPASLGSRSQPLAASTAPWRGDYETGDFSQWTLNVQALPGGATIVTSPVRQGRYAARFHVNPGDDPFGKTSAAPNERADALTDTGEVAGTESWWAWSEFFPNDFAVVPRTSWNIFTSWHNSGCCGQANLMFKVDGSRSSPRLILAVIGGDPNRYAYRVLKLGRLKRNTWFGFVLHVKWEPDLSGFVEVWLNGRLVVPKTFAPTLYYDQTVYLKQGLYRQAYSVPSTIYADAMRLSSTLTGLGCRRAGRGITCSVPAPEPQH